MFPLLLDRVTYPTRRTRVKQSEIYNSITRSGKVLSHLNVLDRENIVEE